MRRCEICGNDYNKACTPLMNCLNVPLRTEKLLNQKIMTTTEIIDEKEVKIDWEFKEIFERHDSSWCGWALEGEGDDGKTYTASTYASAGEPEDTWDEIIDVEEK